MALLCGDREAVAGVLDAIEDVVGAVNDIDLRVYRSDEATKDEVYEARRLAYELRETLERIAR